MFGWGKSGRNDDGKENELKPHRPWSFDKTRIMRPIPADVMTDCKANNDPTRIAIDPTRDDSGTIASVTTREQPATTLAWQAWDDVSAEARAEAAELRARQAEAHVEAAESRLREAEMNEKRSHRLDDECRTLRTALQEQKSVRRKLAEALVSYRDRILLRADLAREEADPRMMPLFEGLSRECLLLLAQAGVEELPSMARFDPDSQLVVETRPTTDPEMADAVAAQHRPGYRFEGRLLRPQEVVLYRHVPETVSGAAKDSAGVSMEASAVGACQPKTTGVDASFPGGAG